MRHPHSQHTSLDSCFGFCSTWGRSMYHYDASVCARSKIKNTHAHTRIRTRIRIGSVYILMGPCAQRSRGHHPLESRQTMSNLREAMVPRL